MPPQQQFGAPPGAPQGMPGGYGQAPPAPYGAPPQQGFAPQPGPGGFPQQQPGAPMMGYGQAPGAIQVPQGPGMGTLQSPGTPTGGPSRRNALMTFLLPGIVIFGGSIVGSVLGSLIWWPLTFLGTLSVLAGAVMYVVSAIKMANELKAVTRNAAFAWWPMLIPFYNYYWAWLMVPAEVTKAKQMMGIQQPTRSIVLYIFLWHFALASDINDMAR
jgi:hypothetical protein